MIELIGVNKRFGDKLVLNNINSKFEPGIPNLIIGASGGGKSVLLKCMVGLFKPEEGEIHYNGRDFVHLPYEQVRDIRREIGMLFQGTALFDSLTVEENVEFPLRMFSPLSPAERKDRVNFCLERVNLENANSKFPAEISGGMKKRVGIARAIALNTKYLFCDEPNSGLDPITSRLIDELLHDITKEFNITTVINSHDMKTVYDIGEHIVFMYKGSVHWEGHRHELDEARHTNKALDDFIRASQF
ncbi:MAG: ATP-binding cassette domain-containing protein [Bacteroidetes bacterium]|nr:ATP-binding cassette domain-containing protein [Bacteroidota bacterium]